MRRYVITPAIFAIIFTIPIVVSMALSMANTGGVAFYFTILYEFPYGNVFERLGAQFFLIGFIGILTSLALALHAEFIYGRGYPIYVSGLLAIITSFILIPVPGSLPGHAVASAISVLTMLIHIGIRKWWYIIVPLLFGVPLMFLWTLGSGDLEFSIIQVLMGGSLLFFIFFDLIFRAPGKYK